MNYDPEGPTSARKSFRVGRWSVDPAACELRDGDTVIRLRPKVMDLLAAFARNPGEVLPKHCLLDMVWPEVTVGDASLTVAVGELRDALGDNPEKPEFIETIPRRGYRLIAPVSGNEVIELGAEASRFWLAGAGLELMLRQGINLIGRAPDAQVRIDSSKVSRNHAKITIHGATAVVEDLGSKNGTFVGNTRVEGSIPLGHGDQLRLGPFGAILSIAVSSQESTVSELSREVEIETSGES